MLNNFFRLYIERGSCNIKSLCNLWIFIKKKKTLICSTCTYNIDQTQPNTKVYFWGLLGVCSGSAFLLFWVNLGFTFGLVGKGFLENWKHWLVKRTSLTILLPEITLPCIFRIHTERCFQWYNYNRGLHSVSAFGLL